MTKNEKRVCIVLAIILVVFTTISFVVPYERDGVFWLSFIFGVISIAAQFCVLKTAFGEDESPRSRFYGFPIARIGLVYMVVQLVLSIVFMAIGSICPKWVPTVLFVVLLGAASLGFIAANVTRNEIERQDATLKADTECMQRLRSIIYPLAEQISDQESADMLKILSDEFRYSDPVSNGSIKDIELELIALVEELQNAVIDNDVESIKELCRKTKVTLTERNRLCKLNKGK